MTSPLHLFLSAFFLVSLVANSPAAAIRWHQITNVRENSHVQFLGRRAVELTNEYFKKFHPDGFYAAIEFIEVFRASWWRDEEQQKMYGLLLRGMMVSAGEVTLGVTIRSDGREDKFKFEWNPWH
ncbi:hypothetical protein HPP92_000562 [Vanilla planifolia]|uniref:Uncharacterized protein n=1 Tax=Vanilla planifolia TaxID=51239 RepID=A0A835S523_VANPL|nr:hypothetical protein HPP92_000610 [Vanilla planifolia]KAG0500490.1 hypothetical protein HPP92_000562 [Vanilla planifolia]